MRRIGTGLLLAVLASVILLGSVSETSAAHDKQGYIYGTVTTRTGNDYTGVLRWADEEAFWDDLFHSMKESNPHAHYLKKGKFRSGDKHLQEEIEISETKEKELRKKERDLRKQEKSSKDEDVREKLYDKRMEIADELIELEEDLIDLREELHRIEAPRTISVFGGAMNINYSDWSNHIFVARFGDIKEIKVIGSEDAEVIMKTGEVYTVSGYANDVGADIVVNDPYLGEIELAWKKIDTITFKPTPKDAKVPGWRIGGKVYTDGDTYEGFIQWDAEECLSIDLLDGDSEDGRMSIPMGSIKSIERRSRNSSKVILRDGREYILDGTNDVDGSIRGIYVEDKTVGRVKVPWEAFDKAEFNEESGSGKAYDEYKPEKRLFATVITVEGKEYKGRMIYDIDESEAWEILDGDRFDIEYMVPFQTIDTITPRSRNSSTVVLRNGTSLRLEESQDVSSSNDGLLIFENEEEEPVYIEWDEVEKITMKW